MEEINKYLTNRIRTKNDKYDGPKYLYKYRPFDDYTFDMFEKKYLYLCQAAKLDDPSECMTNLNIEDLYDYQKDHLKTKCIEQIFDMVKPYTTEENHKAAKSILLQLINNHGTISANKLLDLSLDLQKLYPNINLAPTVNHLVNIPERLENPEIDKKLKEFISVAIDARQKLGICSFSETKDNADMWKNYASNNSGYCIEYEITSYQHNKDIFPVVYNDDRDFNIITQIIDMFINDMISNFSGNTIKTDISQFIRLFITKNLKWKYQKEWRLIGDANEKLQSPKIKTIYLGCNVSTQNEKQIREFFKNTQTKIVAL